MLHYRSLAGIILNSSWLTIGTFDGVHRGHQSIIHQLVSGARQAGVPSVAFTFHPHPAVVLGKRQDPLLITDPQEKAFLLSELGVDIVITYPFTKDTAILTAEEFITMLHEHLGLQRLFVGEDFALGHGREGNVSRLTQLGQKYGYQLEIVSPLKNGDIVISSSQIRSRILDGEVVQAAGLLGRQYKISGQVVPGDARGKMLGIPTANLSISDERMIPKAGVYVCWAAVGGDEWGAVANIGVRPTFEDGTVVPRVEAHLLDFSGDLYGLELSLKFVDRLRDEQRFSSIRSLVEQIQSDIARARAVLTARDLTPL
jgi:riboflavin kinase / FMN adenylyltransferase